MECSVCYNNIEFLKDVYRQYNDVVVCKKCAPSLIKCKCGKTISINSIYRHHQSKIHQDYVVEQLEKLGF
jgi:hypothetical protein